MSVVIDTVRVVGISILVALGTTRFIAVQQINESREKTAKEQAYRWSVLFE